MDPKEYFSKPKSVAQKQYCALAAFFKDGLPAKQAAREYGYSLAAFYSLVRDFTRKLNGKPGDDLFFKAQVRGRRRRGDRKELEALVLSQRAQGLSSPQIQSVLEALGIRVSLGTLWKILNHNGVERLRRRSRAERSSTALPKGIVPPLCAPLTLNSERFSSGGAGLFAFAGFVRQMDLFRAAEGAPVKAGGLFLDPWRAVFSLLAFKLANLHPESSSNWWRFDRGLGLFAGLNVLPGWEEIARCVLEFPPGAAERIRKAVQVFWKISGRGAALPEEEGNLLAFPSLHGTRIFSRSWSGLKKSQFEAASQIDSTLSLAARCCYLLLGAKVSGPAPDVRLFSCLAGRFTIAGGEISVEMNSQRYLPALAAPPQGEPLPWLNGVRLKFSV